MKNKSLLTALLFIAGISLSGLVGYAAFKEAYRNKKIEQEVRALQDEAKRMQDENKALEERIAYFDTAQFRERVAKEKLNMQKSDEKVVVINSRITENGSEEESTQENTAGKSEVETPNHVAWWKYFFAY